VVLITTRRGAEGATRFRIQSQVGVGEQVNRFNLMSGPEWIQFTQEAYANRYADLGNDPEAGRQEVVDLLGHPDEVGTYDWQDAMLRRGMMRRFDISAAGGDEDTRFYLSLGHLDHGADAREGRGAARTGGDPERSEVGDGPECLVVAHRDGGVT
jgi:hypothetical protein